MTTADYDYGPVTSELTALMELGNHGALVRYYLAAAYSYTQLNEQFILKKDWTRICKYLSDNFNRLAFADKEVLVEEDLKNSRCNLVYKKDTFEKKVNFPQGVPGMTHAIELRLEKEGVFTVESSTS